MKLQTMVANKMEQWRDAALLAAARHGKEGGTFKTERWANGKTMVTPETLWANPSHSIPLADFQRLISNGWKVFYD